MSSELIAILTVGIGLLTAIAGLAAVLVTLIIHFDKRATERGDRLQDEMNRQFELMQADMNRQFELMQADMDRKFELIQADMNRRFDAQDERIRGLELGQAHLAGQFDILKDYFTHQPGTE